MNKEDDGKRRDEICVTKMMARTLKRRRPCFRVSKKTSMKSMEVKDENDDLQFYTHVTTNII